MKVISKKTLADKLFPTYKEEEHNESILSIPPEQRRLHTETFDFTISTMLDYLRKDHLFIPEFQRRYVWSQSQASRLIESLIIQCPIPVIYLSQEHDERLSVIDGNQRIRSLDKFTSNVFPLKGLTAYPELEGLHFYELDARFQRHILNRTLRCIIIMKDTHPQVKFDVFERLNTGSVRLTPQELRHGLYHGKLMKLVANLAKESGLQEFIDVEKTDRRMKTEELVIRFLAIHYNFDNYKKPLSQFLNEFAERMRDINDADAEKFTSKFYSTVEGVSSVFGKHAFKIFDEDMTLVSKFNAALYDAEMLAISRSTRLVRGFDQKRRKSFLSTLSSLFVNENFSKSIGRATSDERQIKTRVQMMSNMINKYLL